MLLRGETIPHNNESIPQKKRIKKFVQKHADMFLCYTERAKECLVKEGVDSSKMKIIKLGIDLNRFKVKVKRQKVKKLKSNVKNFTILFVGRLVEEKGTLDLYEAFKNVKSGNYK